jgi:hypothetical protein
VAKTPTPDEYRQAARVCVQAAREDHRAGDIDQAGLLLRAAEIFNAKAFVADVVERARKGEFA